MIRDYISIFVFVMIVSLSILLDRATSLLRISDINIYVYICGVYII